MADDEDAGPGHHQEQGSDHDSGQDDDSQQATHGPNLENAGAHPKCRSPGCGQPLTDSARSRSIHMITELEFVPVPAGALDRIRCNGHDDFGNPLVARIAGAGAPLRCCLRLSAGG